MKWFKLLSVFSLLILSFGADASHIIGGDIYYKYIGDQTGVPNQYEITMVIYREGTGANLQSPLLTDLNITDIRIDGINCSYSQQLQMFRTQPEFPASTLGAFDCILPGSGIPDPQVNIYKDTIVINSSCTQFRIWLLGCCRPNNYTNIQNGGNFYFEAELNRRLGNNSAPNFLNTPVNYACKDAYQVYQQNAVEPDGDSLYYELVPALNTANAQVNYNANFSFTNPISTDPQFPFTLNPGTGTLTFQSNATADEVSTFAIVVREFRFDTLNGIWDEIGFASREIQLVVRTNCRPEVNAGVRLDPLAPGVYLDTLGRQVKDYDCGDTSVTLQFTLPIECFSVADDGTDFRLTTPTGQPLPIKRAVPFCDVNSETDSVRLDLFKPLIFNGDYYLYTKVGTDGNTLFNKCGKSMNEFDTIILRVDDCLDPVYDLENVTVFDDRHTYVQWSLDTNTLSESFVDFIRIFRSDDNGQTYNLVGTANVADSGYVDYTTNGTSVDNNSFRYRAQFIAGGQELDYTRGINSILLEGSLNNGEVPMTWTSYDGWTATYTGELGIADANGDYTWSPINDPFFPTADSSYVFDASGLAEGTYALRVKTNIENDYQSESNWIVFGIPSDPDPVPDPDVVLRIPNVFTPDENALNDRWTIRGIEAFDNVRVTIYDRWGKEVYYNDNYTNANAWNGLTSNGRELAEGTYFYVISATGGPNGSSAQESGSVTLMK